MMNGIKLKLNLIDQFKLFMKNRLEELGVTEGISSDQACFQYINLRRRLIDSISRKVLYSNEFICP